MSKNITIYTTNTCAYCAMVKKYVITKGHTYNEVNLDEKPELRQGVIDMTGQMTVPVTVIKNEDDNSQQVTVGWKPAELAAALA